MSCRRIINRVGATKAKHDPKLTSIVEATLKPCLAAGKWPAVTGGVSIGGLGCLEPEGVTGPTFGAWTNGVCSAQMPTRTVSEGGVAPFHVGSVTKSMTALLGNVLAEEGTLSLFTPVAKIWDDAAEQLEQKSGTATSGGVNDEIVRIVKEMAVVLNTVLPGVTVADLLDHRSGISDSFDVYNIDPKSVRGIMYTVGIFLRHRGCAFATAQEVWKPFFEATEDALEVYQKEIGGSKNKVDANGSSTLSCPTFKEMDFTATEHNMPSVDAVRRLLLDSRHRPLLQVLQRVERDPSLVVKNAEEKKWQYSNFGYGLAAATMEASQFFQHSYENLLFEKVFKPMELTSAGFGEPSDDVNMVSGRTKILNNSNTANSGSQVRVPLGHTYKGILAPSFRFFALPNPHVTHGNGYLPPALTAAGNVHMNTEDMLTYLRYHLSRIQSAEVAINEIPVDETTTGEVPPQANPAQLSMTNPYFPRHPQCQVATEGSANYRNGFILTDPKQETLAVGKMDKSKTSIEFPFNMSHDGSTGAWYSYCCIVPEWDVVSYASANAFPFHMPVLLVPAVKKMAAAAAGKIDVVLENDKKNEFDKVY